MEGAARNAAGSAPGGCVAGWGASAIPAAGRLVRLPREADRGGFMGLFCDENLVSSSRRNVLSTEEARDRSDHMLAAYGAT
jgi:hypothetical protein